MNNIYDEITGNYDELFPKQYWRIIAKRFFEHDYVWPLVENIIIEDFKKTDIHKLSIMAYAMKIREDIRIQRASALTEYKTNHCAAVCVGGNWVVSTQPFIEIHVRDKMPQEPARQTFTGEPHFYEIVRPKCKLRKVQIPSITAYYKEAPYHDLDFYVHDFWEPFFLVPGTKQTHSFYLNRTDRKTIKPVVINHVSEVHSHLGYFTVKSKPKCDLRNGKKYVEKIELPVVYRHKGWYVLKVHEITPFTTKVVYEVKIGRDDSTEMFWEFRHERGHEDKFEIYCGDYDNYFLFLYRKPSNTDSMDYLDDWDKKMIHLKMRTRKISEVNVNNEEVFSNKTQFEFVNDKLFIVREASMTDFFEDLEGKCYEVVAYTPNEKNGTIDSIAALECFTEPTKIERSGVRNKVFVTRDITVKNGFLFIYDDYSLAKNRVIKPKKRLLKKMMESHRKIALEELYENAFNPNREEDDELFYNTPHINREFFESDDSDMLDDNYSSEVISFTRENIGRLKIFL
ncbi:unnamed protein product [Oikopleura dioica]|uniref:Uncharacterized protein n=1 Tax=Oikopleura dioica TaxID=34765 RepID=E4YZH0_OIKDI|nr:unnamed protein product [Oikopleura dioica]